MFKASAALRTVFFRHFSGEVADGTRIVDSTPEAMFVLPTKIKFASEETPTALRAAFAELVTALGPDRQESVFLAEVLWSALHGLVVLMQSERIPASGAEVRLNILVQKFSG
jgi:hypothetical protein